MEELILKYLLMKAAPHMQSDYYVICSETERDYFVMLNLDDRPQTHLVGFSRHNLPGESLQFTRADDMSFTPTAEGWWEISGPFRATLKPAENSAFTLTLHVSPQPVDLDCRIED